MLCDLARPIISSALGLSSKQRLGIMTLDGVALSSGNGVFLAFVNKDTSVHLVPGTYHFREVAIAQVFENSYRAPCCHLISLRVSSHEEYLSSLMSHSYDLFRSVRVRPISVSHSEHEGRRWTMACSRCSWVQAWECQRSDCNVTKLRDRFETSIKCMKIPK